MSSVVSVTVYQGISRPWANGLVKRRYSVVLEDNLLDRHTFIIGPFKVLSADDGSSHALAFLQRKVIAEVLGAQSNGDPLGTTLTPQWTTTKDCAKSLIRWMIRERDPYIVLYLKPLIEHIQANFTGAQVANLLDFTIPQVQRLNRRVNAILTDTGTAEALLAAYDAEQEVIE